MHECFIDVHVAKTTDVGDNWVLSVIYSSNMLLGVHETNYTICHNIFALYQFSMNVVQSKQRIHYISTLITDEK